MISSHRIAWLKIFSDFDSALVASNGADMAVDLSLDKSAENSIDPASGIAA